MSDPVSLYYRELGDRSKPTLCLLHGLFGSSSNWMGITKLLQEEYHIIVPDLRNHGRSEHRSEMDYAVMTEDVLALIGRLDLQNVYLLGHSMGGKVAMRAALIQPEWIGKLVVADIAPVTYAERFALIFQGLSSLSLNQLKNREQAYQHLAKSVREPSVRDYLLQNLVKQRSGWGWRFNLPVLQHAMPSLAAFPDAQQRSYPGDVLFLHGERSDYITDAAQPVIQALFPHHRRRVLNGTGHWLYAEQPHLFAQAVRYFLK
ncbi:MAG: alpha/beta fold hydrolase [Candidatus Thiodiazotropha sp.]|jgi:esterase